VTVPVPAERLQARRPGAPPRLSLILPVFRSELNIPPLLTALDAFARKHADELELECVFVIDGSPDDSHGVLLALLPQYDAFLAQVHDLSRNFGAPFATRCGFERATGDYFAPVAADLQEPFESIHEMFRQVRDGVADVCFGQRVAREDPWLSKQFSAVYWALYRRLIARELPPGGADLFVCNQRVRGALLQLREKNGFLVGQVLWMGFRRTFVPYVRRKREIGQSSWSFRKRIAYLMDSLFLFSDLPIKALLSLGIFGLLISALLATSLVVNSLLGSLPVPGYAATVTTVSFFGGLNSLGFGILGEYLWRTYQNTQQRPLSLVREEHRFHYPELPPDR
jgi:glycosyltransferase involved in cell wall biosynthesis